MASETKSAALTITASSFSRAAVLAAGVDVASVTWRISAMLAEHGPLQPSQIAKRERTSRATTSEVLKRMAKEGRIVRIQNDHDKRSTLVALTDSGLADLYSWRNRVSEVLDPLLAELTTEDLEILHRANTILRGLTSRLREEAQS